MFGDSIYCCRAKGASVVLIRAYEFDLVTIFYMVMYQPSFIRVFAFVEPERAIDFQIVQLVYYFLFSGL